MEILKCYRFFSRQNPTLLLGSWNLVLVLLAIWQLASAQHVFQVLSNFSWIFTGVEGDGRDVGEVEDGAVEVTEDVEEETVEDVEGKEVEGECIYTAMSMENFMYSVGMRQHAQLQDVAWPYDEILAQ